MGYTILECTIINCYNTGSVNNNSEKLYTGGILAYLDRSTVVNCYNTGAIESKGTRVGGIVGHATYASTVTNCYNTGSVSGGDPVGGVVGRCYYYNSGDLTVKNCYFNSDNFSGDALGEVSSETIINNVVGYSTDIMKNSYFVALLNNGAYTYNEEETTTIEACGWKAASDGYPTFDIYNTPSYIDLSSCTAMGSGTDSDPYLIFAGRPCERY